MFLLRLSACGPDSSRWEWGDPCYRMITGPPTGPEVSAPASHVQLYHSFVQVCISNTPEGQRFYNLSGWPVPGAATLSWEKLPKFWILFASFTCERGPTFSSAARPRPGSALGFHHSDLALQCQPGRISLDAFPSLQRSYSFLATQGKSLNRKITHKYTHLTGSLE